jgi:hypothetical protein
MIKFENGEEFLELADAKLGDIINYSSKTPQGRLYAAELSKKLFEYFGAISRGTSGWGISFMDYLELHEGLKPTGFKQLTRVLSFEEEMSLAGQIYEKDKPNEI